MRRRDVLTAAALGGVAVAGGAIAGPPAATLPPAKDDLARTLAHYASEARLPGIAVTVTQGGATAGFWSAGAASLPFDVPVAPDTLFHLGSIGKHVTAVAVLQLAEQKLVDLNAAIGRYVPGLPGAWANRSLHSLLSLTSGLPDYTEALPDFSLPQPRDVVMAAIGDLPMEFGEGQAWSYSNTNYLLLGWLIEDVTKASYADMLANNVFGKAGTPHARVDNATAIIGRRAEPYSMVGLEVCHASAMDGPVSGAADGGVLFSGLDFAPWTAALASTALGSRDWIGRAIVPTRLSSGRQAPYGYGWFLAKTRGQDIQLHTGSVPGYTAVFVNLPAAQLSVAVTANVDANSNLLRAMAWHAAESYAPGSTFISLNPITRDAVDDRLEHVLAVGPDIVADDATFAPEWRLILDRPATRTRAMTYFGKDVRATPLESYAVEGGRMRRYRIESSLGSDHLTAGFDDTGRIFWIYPI